MDKYMNMQDCRNILRIIREGSNELSRIAVIAKAQVQLLGQYSVFGL